MKKLSPITHNLSPKRAFTLVELIVSVAVFSVVMLIAVGALLSLLAANQRAQTLKVVMNNLNLAMENMVKDVRVGTVYHCGGAPYNTPADCNGTPFFAFRPSGEVAGNEIVFILNNGAIERSDDGGANFAAITSPDVTVEYLEFRVWGSGSGDGLQPRVKISISGVAGVDEDTQTDFNIQATAVQRLIDS